MAKIKLLQAISLFTILILGVFCFFPKINALIISQIYITEFSIEKSNYNTGEEIKGGFTLWNYEKSVVPDLTFRFKTLAQDDDGFFTVVMDDQSSGNYFLLNPDQKLTKTFSYRLPQNLPSGDYKFRTQLFNSKGVPMVWKEVIITVKGNERFLNLKNFWFLRGGEKIPPEGEATYDLGEVPKITFDISNQSSFVIQAYPKITIYQYNINENPIKEIKKELLTINPGGINNKEFDLIQLNEPDSYLCQVVMYDQNNNSVSNYIYFRLISSGEKVEIIQIQTDQTSYQAGEEAEVSVDIAASSETEERGYLSVKISDQEGLIAGEEKKEISLSGGKINLQVPITKEVPNPEIETTITSKEDEKLDQYKIKMETQPLPEKKEIPWGKIAIGILIFGVMIFIVCYFLRRKKIPPAHLIFFGIILGGLMLFLGSQTVSAVTEVSAGPGNNTAIIWNNPLPEYLYEAGSYVPFSGGIFVPSHFWELDNNKIEFFVGDLSDVKLENHDMGENKIKVIDEERSNVIKIGEVTRPASDLVEYDKALKIPADLPYLGAVRFYVQFRGQAADMHHNRWHWIIAYQEVEIQNTGEGGFEISLAADKTEARVNDELTYIVELSNKPPCIRIPVDVIEIIDRSGSMAGQKLIDAKAAAKIFVDQMDPAYDQIGLVSYETTSILGSSLTTDFALVKTKINALIVAGNTCISCGIRDANSEIINNGRLEVARYEVLMTDGLANVSDILALTPRNAAKLRAQEALNNGIIIYTVGFGAGADGILLQDIANITGGTYFFAPDGERLKEIYKAIAGLLIGWSFGTKIIIDIPEEYLTVESFDPSCTFDGDVLTCEIGDLECGGKTIVEPMIFRAKIKATVPDETVIEMQAQVINDASQKKDSNLVDVLVHAKKPPHISSQKNSDPIYCTNVPERGQVGFTWKYMDNDKDPEYRFDFQVDDNSDFSSPEVDRRYCNLSYGDPPTVNAQSVEIIPSLTPSFRTFCAGTPDEYTVSTPDAITYTGDDYYWRVRVWDNSGVSSGWQEGKSFEVAHHPYPWPDFTWLPSDPVQDEIVVFDPDNSEVYDGGSLDTASYDWQVTLGGGIFEDGTGHNDRYPHIKFPTDDNKVKLTLTDTSGFSCPLEKAIGIALPLPEWKEVPPIIWLRKLLAIVSDFFNF